MERKKNIAIISPSEEFYTPEIYDFALSLGKELANKGFLLLSGGKTVVTYTGKPAGKRNDNKNNTPILKTKIITDILNYIEQNINGNK